MKQSDILFVITTYNQSDYTRTCFDSLSLISDKHDILVVDDVSTDNTIELCKEYNINYISKDTGKGLTNSWNLGYKYFLEKGYKYFILANNDVIVPDLAITEMKNVLDKWPSSLVVPLSTTHGAGHNPLQIIDHWYGAQPDYNEPENYQKIQDMLLDSKKTESRSNNLYKFDPVRMKMFNGFFFMMNEQIKQYERKDGNLFDPEFLNTKGEDEFNWSKLIPNNDFSILCRTAFIYHFKGVSTFKVIENYVEKSNDTEWLKTRI